MNFVFEPLHEEVLGTDPSGQFLNGNFPYNQPSATVGVDEVVPGSDIATFGGGE